MAYVISRFGPPLALMGLIFFLSAQPGLDSGLGWIDTVLRKCAHMLEFGVLCLLWWRALGYRALAAAAGIALAYAISDEFHQSFVADRHGSPVDVAIDALGIAAAVLVARLRASSSSWRRRPRPSAARRPSS